MLTLKHATMLGPIAPNWGADRLHRLLSGHFPGEWGDDGGPHMFRVLRSTNLTDDGRLDLGDVAVRSIHPKKAAALEPRQNDILLERSGGGPGQAVGRVGMVEGHMPGYAFSNFLHLLRPAPERIDPRFLARVLHWINRTGRILRLEQQTTQMRNLHFRDYLTMPLPVPPRDEQTVIVRVFDAVDTAIERTREAWDRAREVKRALSQRVFKEGVQREKQRKTPIGWIPESWAVVTVASLVEEFQYGLSVPMQKKGLVPILRMGNIQAGDVIVGDLKYVSLPERVTAPYALSRGDVLFNRTNSQELVGKVGIYRSHLPAVFASYLIRLQLKQAKVDNYYLAQLLNSYDAQCRIRRYATPGVQQVNINATNLGKVLVPLPVGPEGLHEQGRIAHILEHADLCVRNFFPKLEALTALKRSLMRDLLTGKVRVNIANVETAVSA
jgi:type I restriction enzyme S subunit